MKWACGLVLCVSFSLLVSSYSAAQISGGPGNPNYREPSLDVPHSATFDLPNSPKIRPSIESPALERSPQVADASDQSSIFKEVAKSEWFGLISGLASIAAFIFALYQTQISPLPFSLYRSLTWRRVLLLSSGVGLFVGSVVTFYLQSSPPGLPIFHQAHELLHGYSLFYVKDFFYGHEHDTGTPVWAILALVGILIALYGVKYDPIKRVRKIVVRERSAIQSAMGTQLVEAFGGVSFEELTSSQQERYQDIVNYYEEFQRRMLDVFIGPLPAVFFQRARSAS